MTALAGTVLMLNDKPLAQVKVAVGAVSSITDRNGQFLLKGVRAGRQVLLVDGRSASRSGAAYGVFMFDVELEAGKTTRLAQPVWMPKLDTAHAVRIASPSTKDAVVTTPLIRGLELHIPKGTVIRDIDGKAVTEVSITPIPLDRTPFPTPGGVEFPLFFTLQPGGAVVEAANGGPTPELKLVYPNADEFPAGTRIAFWGFDPARNRSWYTLGNGTVTKDRKRVVPDEGVSIDRFTCASIGSPFRLPDWILELLGGLIGGDPVDLATGIFAHSKTDLALPDVIPIDVTRTYRPGDGVVRTFGLGVTHTYDVEIVGDSTAYSWADIGLPGGARVHYQRTSPGTTKAGAVMKHTGSASPFLDSTLRWDTARNDWVIDFVDGSRWLFRTDWGPEIVTLVAIVDRNGNTLTINRDVNRRVTSVVSPSGRWIQYSYDAANRVSAITDVAGRTVSYTYDGSGRLATVTDPAGAVTTHTYDAMNRLRSIRDPRNITFLTNDYDSAGRVIRQTLADGSTYEFDYVLVDGEVTQAEVTDPRGHVRRVAVNSAGYAVSDTAAADTPQEQTVTFVRQAHGNLPTQITDHAGRTTTVAYNQAGRPTSVTELAGTPDAQTTTFGYEPMFNQIASVTDPLSRTTTFGYGTEGNLTSITDPLNRVTTATYDAAGMPLTVTDPLGRTTTVTYDLGNLETLTDPLGRTTRLGYDVAGRMVAATDPAGVVTRQEYDAFNQVTAVVDGLGRRTEFGYDGNGNLTSLTDPADHTTSYTYDPMDRVLTRTDPLNRTATYGYDPNGNLAATTTPAGTVTEYRYDVLDRLVFTGFDRTAPDTYESTLTQAYDPVGRLAGITDTAAGQVSFGYDAFDRLVSETTPDATTGYGYDQIGRRTSRSLTGSPTVTYAYDSADRLTTITQGSLTAGFTWDNADRLTALSLPNQVAAGYSYDNADQLTSVAWTRAGNPVGDLTYRYDRRGLRTGVGGSLAAVDLPAEVTGAVYNAGDQLTSWNGQALSYDTDGHLVGDVSRSLTWNARGQLTTVTTAGAGTVTFEYDPLGRRRSVDTTTDPTTRFLYDGANPVATTTTAGVHTSEWFTGPGLDSTLAVTDQAGVTRTLISDALGSTLGAIDPTGTLATTRSYTPHGQATTTGTPASSLGYTGREHDPTALIYLRARYYDPAMGRFISPDPIGFAGGDTNLYSYAANNPVNYTDPTGLTPWSLIGCGVGAAIFGGRAALSGRKSGWGITGAAIGGCLTGLGVVGLGKVIGGAVIGPWIRAASAAHLRVATWTRYTQVVASQSIRQRGPVLTGAMDLRTGIVHFGQNTGVPAPLHPLLRSRLARFIGPGAQGKGIPGGHSEFNALNAGLFARPGSQLDDFTLFSVRLRGALQGTPIRKCPNCATLLDDVLEIM